MHDEFEDLNEFSDEEKAEAIKGFFDALADTFQETTRHVENPFKEVANAAFDMHTAFMDAGFDERLATYYTQAMIEMIIKEANKSL